ncbi:MAG: succinate dehydrogenase assembly factor 2 [Paracoccaceae bacterium]|nr:succinate dehydrogenase assembly factor 2 [Paracoccaceae bacterium]
MRSKLGKIGYRAKYRSIREMDLIFRQFWEIFKKNYTEEELVKFEKLIEEDDFDLYQWISGVTAVPAKYQSLISQIEEQIVHSRGKK